MKNRMAPALVAIVLAAVPRSAHAAVVEALPFAEGPRALGVQLQGAILSGGPLFYALEKQTSIDMAFHLPQLDLSQAADRRILGGLLNGVPEAELARALAATDPADADVKAVAAQIAAARRSAASQLVPIVREEVGRSLADLETGALDEKGFLERTRQMEKLRIFGQSIDLLTSRMTEVAGHIRREGGIMGEALKWAGHYKKEVATLDLTAREIPVPAGVNPLAGLNEAQQREATLLMARLERQPGTPESAKQFHEGLRAIAAGQTAAQFLDPGAAIPSVGLSEMKLGPDAPAAPATGGNATVEGSKTVFLIGAASQAREGRGLLSALYDLPGNLVGMPERRFAREHRAELTAIPGVTKVVVGWGLTTPYTGGWVVKVYHDASTTREAVEKSLALDPYSPITVQVEPAKQGAIERLWSEAPDTAMGIAMLIGIVAIILQATGVTAVEPGLIFLGAIIGGIVGMLFTKTWDGSSSFEDISAVLGSVVLGAMLGAPVFWLLGVFGHLLRLWTSRGLS